MENDAVSLHWPFNVSLVKMCSETVGILIDPYDPSDTFLRHTCDDKASPRGECSPFIQQKVMKTDVLG